MAWNDLKAAVAAVIKTNGTQAITGAILQASLNSIIDQVGYNSTYKGLAIPSTNPGTPDGPVYYLASTPGTYSNFGGAIVSKKLSVLSNPGNGSWSIVEIDVPNNTEFQNINKQVSSGKTVSLMYAGGYVNTGTGISTGNINDYKYVLFPVYPGEKYIIYSDRVNDLCAYMTSETTQKSRFSLALGRNEITIPTGCNFLAITLEFTTGGSKAGDWKNVSINLKTPLMVKLIEGMDRAAIAYSVVEPSKNLFDKNSVINGFYVATTLGVLGTESTSAVSPLIPVTGGQMYYLSGRNSTGYSELRFLNASGTPLKPLNPDTGVELSSYSLGYLNGKVLAPATAVYCQFTIKFIGVGTFDAIQFELGNVQTTYIPFGYKIKSSALEDVVTQSELDAVELIANDANTNAELALTNIEFLQSGLATRVNTSENTATPGAFPTVADQANSFGVTVSADTESPVKDYIGYKRTFLTNLQSGNGTSYRTWTLPLAGQARPSEICVALWTKKSEFQAIHVSNFQSYLGLAMFSLNPTAAFSGTPVLATGNPASSTELSAAKLEFSVIAEVGDYVRIKLKYYDLVWKGTFTGSSMTYYWLFNGSYANGKPLTMIDFTCLLGSQATGMLVYPDSGTLTGTETIKGAYALGNSNASRISALESSASGTGVRMKKVGNMIYIASPWDATYDLVKAVEVIRSSSYTNNPDANFVNEYLCAKGGDPSVSAVSLKGSGDDICPANLNGSDIGGNHSWNQGYNVQMTNHGKTLADIGSVYRNGSNVEFVIARIVDANNIWMISKNQAVDGFTYSFAQPSGTLTYYSNGANTGNIVVASSSGLGNTYTTVAPATVKVLMDGKTEITSDGTYYGKYIDIVESYDALDLPSIVLQLIANRPSGGYTSAPQLNSLAGTEKLFNHSINYRFTKNGNTVVSTTFRAYKKLVMNFHGFIQAGALGSGNIYCPKSLPISDGSTTYDLRQICNWTTPPAVPLNLTPTYWENPLSPPDRVVNLNATVALMLGYITDRGIQSSRKDVVYNSMFLNTSRKLYPMGVHNQSSVAIDPNTFYSCIAYRTYTNPVANPAGRTNYAYVEVGGSVFIFLDYHGALNDSIIPETEWVGKSITVYEKNNKCTLIGNVVTGAIEVLSTATSTDPGYIVLKLS